MMLASFGVIAWGGACGHDSVPRRGRVSTNVNVHARVQELTFSGLEKLRPHESK